MGSYSVGEALNLFLERSKWKSKVFEIRLKNEWEQIAGKTIARYTRNVALNGKTLTIQTDVGPLKQELQFGKEVLQKNINEYFGERVVEQIIIG